MNAFRIVFVALLVTLVAGCGDDDDSPTSPGPPPPPNNVQALATDGTVTVTWDVVANVPRYVVYWNTTGDVTTADNQIQSAPNPLVHANRTNGTTYYYIVTALDAEGQSAPSEEASATPTP